MPTMEPTSFLFNQKLLHYTGELSFLKKILQTFVKQPQIKEKIIQQMEKVQKIIKAIKKHQKVHFSMTKQQKLSDIQLVEIFGSSFDYIDQRLREIVYPVKLLKSDFQLYMIWRYVKMNEKTCGITMNIDTEKHDDRMVIQTNLTQIIDIQYHRFSIKSLLLKASEIMKNFKYHAVIHENGLQVDVLLHEIVKNYNLVPYHNFTHAFSVFAMFYYFAKCNSISQYMTDFELYFSLIACLSHDLRHNGFNSIYETKIRSEVAMNFGNISTLEKMHKSVAFEILEGLGQNSPLTTLTPQQKKYAKKIMINCILATDMAKHYDYISHLKHDKLQLSKQPDRLFLMQTLIHACDIGNAMFDYENYITWANLVCVQFHEQTIKQESEGLEMTNHMRFQSLNYFYKNQASFINSIVMPLWQTLGEQLNEKKIQEKVFVIKENSRKVSEQMRRNSDCLPKNSVAKYLGSLLKQLKL